MHAYDKDPDGSPEFAGAPSALARMKVPTREEAEHFTRNLWWDGRLAVSQLTSSASKVQNVYKFEELALVLLGPDGIERPLADHGKLVLTSVDADALRKWVRDWVQDAELAEALDELVPQQGPAHERMVAIRRCLGRRWMQYRQALGLDTAGDASSGDAADAAAPGGGPPAAAVLAGAAAPHGGAPISPEGRKQDFPLLSGPVPPTAEGAAKEPVPAGPGGRPEPDDPAGANARSDADAGERVSEGTDRGVQQDAGSGCSARSDASAACSARRDAGVYLDNAATTQKPRAVLDAVRSYYETANGNPYRGIYPLSAYAERLYEGARQQVARFINAAHAEEVVFTGGTTASLNQLAWSYGMAHLGPGDGIVIPISEHHSNLVPWQRVAQATGARLVFLHPGEDGCVSADQVRQAVDARTKVVALAHASNVLGLLNPVREIADIAHAAGAVLVLDAAQTVAHVPFDVRALDADFMAFSGHKAYGPMGIGVLYGKRGLLEELDPAFSGGGMVRTVHEEGATWAPLPRKLEAGTPNVGGAVGLAQALGYLDGLGMDAVRSHEARLIARALEGLREVPGAKVYGNPRAGDRCGLVSFNVGAIHAEDIARGMARRGVSVKSGNHCAQPLMRYLGVTSTCRISVSVANSESDIDRFLDALHGTLRDIGNFVMSYAGL